jgi:hypothetical protein
MDKVADFYERWYATKRIPDYCGVESASEELAKQLLGVYESNLRCPIPARNDSAFSLPSTFVWSRANDRSGCDRVPRGSTH